MYNSYNTAFNYLKNKYGYQRSRLIHKKENEYRKMRTKKQRLEFKKNLTDNDYNLVINTVTDETDKLILLLMGQFNYGIHAKRELSLLLFNLGITDNIG